MASKKRKVAKQASAMDILLTRTGAARHTPITLSDDYPDVLSVARSDVFGLLSSNLGLHIGEARELLQRARAMSVVVARQFREQRLTASVRTANRPPSGIKGLVDGPTYTDMFNPDWANHCPPDAIEATTSPVAYLADLYRYALDLEATGKESEVITLNARRPDLKELVLDHTALNRIEPTIVLVNEILETSIRSHLDGISDDRSVDDALLGARYPNALPFERYTSQINYVLERKSYALGDAIRLADPAYPYFKEPGVHSAGAGLYQWLLSQMSTLYFQAYDAVLAMCLGAEACWQYEIGDRETRFISTTAWADNRFGLTAGETLKLGLLQMESAFLARHERRLELTKTISLKALLSAYDPNTQADGALATGWERVIETLLANGEIPFQLKASTFDKDYPGHYLRQLTRVSVSLPVVLEPYQDIHATLSQQASSYLLQPQIGNVKYLYQLAGDLPTGDDDDIRQDQIVFNPRPNQQIGVSTGVDDHGMFTLDFGDERYFPFEGTGAISSWTLSFPNHESEKQQAILNSLTDIILHVRYLAVDGGKVFTAQVEDLVAAVEEGEARRRQLLSASMKAISQVH